MPRKTIFAAVLLPTVAVLILGGCASVMKGAPLARTKVDVGSMQRSDYVVIDRAEGVSDQVSILFGIIQIIDSDKLKLFWIPFYEEKYAVIEKPPWLVGPEDRAYYKALAAQPDADGIIPRAYAVEKRGIPFLADKKSVTFTGKAIKLKTDTDLGR
jgi:hypothetical protein